MHELFYLYMDRLVGRLVLPKIEIIVHGCSVVSDSLRPYGLWSTRLLCLWDSPGKNIGVGCHGLLQGIFPTQGLYLCLLCLL